MKARKIVGWNLRRIRVERDLTIGDLAVDAEVDSSFVARIERGVVNSSIDVLERLAEVLKVRLVEFFVEPLPNAPKPKPMKSGRRASLSPKASSTNQR